MADLKDFSVTPRNWKVKSISETYSSGATFIVSVHVSMTHSFKQLKTQIINSDVICFGATREEARQSVVRVLHDIMLRTASLIPVTTTDMSKEDFERLPECDQLLKIIACIKKLKDQVAYLSITGNTCCVGPCEEEDIMAPDGGLYVCSLVVDR